MTGSWNRKVPERTYKLKRRSVKIAVLLLISLVTPIGVMAQTRDAQETIRLSTNLVVVDTQVLRRKSGEVINGLSADDFEIYEDGVRQEITHFSQDKLALSVILLIDLSGSVSPVLHYISDGALSALQRLKESDEVALMTFSSSTQLLQDFTKDRELVVERIGSIEKSPVIGQGTLLYKALYEAAMHMNKAGNPTSRRVIVTITDNVSWDYYNYGVSEQEVFDRVIQSGSMVCGLIVEGSLSRAEKIFRRDKDGRDMFRRRMTIDQFVNQTGGEQMKAPSTEISMRLSQLIDHLRTSYSIGFSPGRDQNDGRYRRINIALTPQARKRLGDVVIRFKQGYYAR